MNSELGLASDKKITEVSLILFFGKYQGKFQLAISLAARLANVKD